jgi:hypothetical protein
LQDGVQSQFRPSAAKEFLTVEEAYQTMNALTRSATSALPR